MRKAILAGVMLGLLGGRAALAGEPVLLVCTGTGTETTSTMNQDLTWKNDSFSKDISFQVSLDFDRPKVVMNGREMVVRSISEDEVVFSTRKPGLVSAVLEAPVFTISRKTGVFRGGGASGRCERPVVKENLF